MAFENYGTLRDAGLFVVGLVTDAVVSELAADPQRFLEQITIGDRQKSALRIDVFAEDLAARRFRKYLSNKGIPITVVGEESLFRDDLSADPGVVAVLDMVDGTDLLERGLSNWCSAVAFVEPSAAPGQRLLGTFVGLPDGRIYFATADREGAYVREARGKPLRTRGPSSVTALADASLCFYGQKASGFRRFFESGLFELFERESQASGGRARVYNLAGNPLAARMADHRVPGASGIDAIVELGGQYVHDFVPGAYIAVKSGAHLAKLDGSPMAVDELEAGLLAPATDKQTYLLTSTARLAAELAGGLRGEAAPLGPVPTRARTLF